VKLVEQAPGKVNLCLYLGPVRADARHDLVTVYESVSLCDTLTVTEAASIDDEVVCPGVEGPNLVGDVLAGLRAIGWQAPPLRVSVEKRIPVAAGMAGGSADAGAMLRLARRIGGGFDEEQLWSLARSLGSDVPAQFSPGTSLGIGAGEIVEQLAPLAAHALAIVPVDFGLSTPAVYREADRLGLPRSSDDLEGRLAEVSGWFRHGARPPARLLVNDLEPAARSLCAEIDLALAALRDAGAEVAFVCGSGPTCAGLWWGPGARAAANGAVAEIVRRFPRAIAVEPVSLEQLLG